MSTSTRLTARLTARHPILPHEFVRTYRHDKTRLHVLGLPFDALTMSETVRLIERRIAAGRPGYVVTPNLNFAMLCRENPRLVRVLNDAAVVVADGMPLVWASRLARKPLPERVTGSDLVPAVCRAAAESGYRIYILGGAPGVAELAARNLTARFPGLNVVGVDSPPFRELTEEENAAVVARVRAVKPDILFMASSQPRGELWLCENHQALGVPVQLQVGAAIDFAAGRVKRAPRWVGRIGLEWAFRFAIEPRRLGGRYLRNACFLLREVARGLAELVRPRRRRGYEVR